MRMLLIYEFAVSVVVGLFLIPKFGILKAWMISLAALLLLDIVTVFLFSFVVQDL